MEGGSEGTSMEGRSSYFHGVPSTATTVVQAIANYAAVNMDTFFDESYKLKLEFPFDLLSTEWPLGLPSLTFFRISCKLPDHLLSHLR